MGEDTRVEETGEVVAGCRISIGIDRGDRDGVPVLIRCDTYNTMRIAVNRSNIAEWILRNKPLRNTFAVLNGMNSSRCFKRERYRVISDRRASTFDTPRVADRRGVVDISFIGAAGRFELMALEHGIDSVREEACPSLLRTSGANSMEVMEDDILLIYNWNSAKIL